MEQEREILFGGWNYRNEWITGSACHDDDNIGWLILGPYMSEETDAACVDHVYQYTGIDFKGQEIFEGSRIIGAYQWMDRDGTAMSREIDDVVVFSRGCWVLESTGESLYELMDNDQLYWDAEIILPKNKRVKAKQ